MLKSFGPNIWIADGPTVEAAAGFCYPTRMAVIRLTDGRLVVWSPVALTAELRTAVEALGTVGFLIPPNDLHDTFLADWQRAWRDAEVYAPPGLSAKRPDITFSGEIGDNATPDWEGAIDIELVRGNRITTEAVLFHHDSRTVLFADLLQQFPPAWFKGWRAIVARLDLMVTPRPAVPRKFRLAFTDRAAARTSLRRILAWPADKVLIAHGAPVTEDGQAFLRQAFQWLRVN